MYVYSVIRNFVQILAVRECVDGDPLHKRSDLLCVFFFRELIAGGLCPIRRLRRSCSLLSNHSSVSGSDRAGARCFRQMSRQSARKHHSKRRLCGVTLWRAHGGRGTGRHGAKLAARRNILGLLAYRSYAVQSRIQPLLPSREFPQMC